MRIAESASKADTVKNTVGEFYGRTTMTDALQMTHDSDGSMPSTIRAFERVQITALVTGWMAATITYHEMLHERLHPVLFAVALSALSVLVFFMMARVSRKRCTTCRWLLVAVSALSMGPWFIALMHTNADSLVGGLLSLQGLLQVGACALLVAQPSHAWLVAVEG